VGLISIDPSLVLKYIKGKKEPYAFRRGISAFLVQTLPKYILTVIEHSCVNVYEHRGMGDIGLILF
jgi:hypothetical protein